MLQAPQGIEPCFSWQRQKVIKKERGRQDIYDTRPNRGAEKEEVIILS
jgi:hypothetical protein